VKDHKDDDDDAPWPGGATSTVRTVDGIHAADSPDGPWERVDATGYAHCNNPTPWVVANGTIVVACTWFLQAAESVEGPWRQLGTIPIAPSTRKGEPGFWEDPCVSSPLRII
jgi:hypothetical protein